MGLPIRRWGVGVAVLCLFLLPFALDGRDAWAGEAPAALQKCAKCHKDYVSKFAPTKHGKIFINNPRNELEAQICQACHGNGDRHIEDARVKADSGAPIDLNLIRAFTEHSPLNSQQKNEACLQCHQDQRRALWQGSGHEKEGLACITCHQHIQILPVKIYENVTRTLPDEVDIRTELCLSCHQERLAGLNSSSHMPLREGKMNCASCHNPHGAHNKNLLKADSVNQTCYECHAEKRGPFLWEHAPARENCANCHDPHGTTTSGLTSAKGSFLCLQCHGYGGHVNAPRYNRSSASLGQGCINCHSRIHGSNHPSGAKFTR